jgi:AcrR family transcriptional regulator
LSVQREDRKKSTRLALRRVAVQLFKEQGFVETTVEQIAAQAGVSTRTFFNYFATKDEAVMLPYDDLSLLLRDEIKRRPVREAPYDSARHAAHAAFTFLAADDDLVGLLLDSARLLRTEPALRAADSALQLVWEDEMTQAFGERGLTIEPLAARVHAAVAVAATRAGVFSWAEGESSSQHSLAAAIDAAFEALESGGHRET